MSLLAEAGIVTLTVAESAIIAGIGYGLRKLFTAVSDTSQKVTTMHAMLPTLDSRVAVLERRQDNADKALAANTASVAVLLERTTATRRD